jgi:hypothetical protein
MAQVIGRWVAIWKIYQDKKNKSFEKRKAFMGHNGPLNKTSYVKLLIQAQIILTFLHWIKTLISEYFYIIMAGWKQKATRINQRDMYILQQTVTSRSFLSYTIFL